VVGVIVVKIDLNPNYESISNSNKKEAILMLKIASWSGIFLKEQNAG
jgi:hypothetical protein